MEDDGEVDAVDDMEADELTENGICVTVVDADELMDGDEVGNTDNVGLTEPVVDAEELTEDV